MVRPATGMALVLSLLFSSAPAASQARDEPGAAPTAPLKGEAWRFNARERTEQAARALENGNAETAVELFDAAQRLDPASGRALFNAATARLLAGDEAAAEHLTTALSTAPAELLPATGYNLGNAHLAAGDPLSAIEAYKTALRADPSLMDAKINLEIALRLLEEQKQQRQEDQQGGEQQDEQPQSSDSNQQSDPQEGQDGQEQEESQEPDQDEADDNKSRAGEREDSEPETPEQQPETRPAGEPETEDQRRDALQDFDEQQDMTAEQAAAILEAVENLERDHRRKQAEERARRRSRDGKDW